LAAAKSPLYVEARHRWRRHRRIRPKREREEDKEARKETPDEPSKPAPPSTPPPAGSQPKHKGTAQAPEPMGPPPPPPEWSAAEIKAAQIDCGRRLSGLGLLYDQLAPLKEGVCGSPAPIRLNGFEAGREPAAALSPAPTVSCKLGEALHRWVHDVIQPNAKTYLHASVVRIATLSAYNCRARYDNPFQRMSEHAYANAVDVSEFVTAKGEHVSVLDHWSEEGDRGTFLHKIHEGACEIFGTTLGPAANSAHKNHFHLDMRERRRPLCDFTPEQARAQMEAAKHAAASAKAGAEAHVSGGDKPSAAAPQTSVAAPPESQAGAGVKPSLAKLKRQARNGRRRHRRHGRYR
jgi:hypothetical protein